jgi:hypothetical protein
LWPENNVLERPAGSNSTFDALPPDRQRFG